MWDHMRANICHGTSPQQDDMNSITKRNCEFYLLICENSVIDVLDKRCLFFLTSQLS